MSNMYAIHNTVRKQSTRLQRYAAPTAPRYKQHILSDQRRLLRGRPVLVSEETLLEHIEELKQKNALGVLEVRTTDGRLIDLNTMQAAPTPVSPPLPNPPLDSVANDKQGVGENMPRFPGDVADPALPPSALESEAAEGELEESGPEVPPPAGEEAEVVHREPSTSSKKKGRR